MKKGVDNKMNCKACDNPLINDSESVPWSFEHDVFLGLCHGCGRELAAELVRSFASKKKSMLYRLGHIKNGWKMSGND